MNRDDVPFEVSKRMGDRPVRWAPPEKLVGDYDGRERTLEVFNAAATEQRVLLAALRPIREQMREASGGSVVFIFHTPEQSERLYGDFVRTWVKTG